MKIAVKELAKAWSLGTSHGRGETSAIGKDVRLHVLKTVVLPIATTFARSRVWTGRQLKTLQSAANYAVRRAMGMDQLIMRENGVSDRMMYKAARWDTVEDLMCRHTMQWVGHVARMPTWRRPKQILFGWMTDQPLKIRTGMRTVNGWYKKVLTKAGLETIDWFRQAQDRKGWKRKIGEAFPGKCLDEDAKRAIRQWKPSESLPISDEETSGEGQRSSDDSEVEKDGVYRCPVCTEEFEAGNSLQFHYEAQHSVRDPEIVTKFTYTCDTCKKYIATAHELKIHECPAKVKLKERQRTTVGNWLPVRQQPERPPPAYWIIATDGSGQETWVNGKKVCVAGWGVAVFRGPVESMEPDFTLHAPVVVEEWDHLWIGAREKTNNTGELSAIGEAMLWLLDEAPDGGAVPVEIRFDSYYAANMAQGIWDPKSNEELAAKVREITKRVMEKRMTEWTHVYGHTGAHDNEVADRAADLGANGKVSAHSRRWAAPPPEIHQDGGEKIDI